MRIAVSGTHCIGKTTLIRDFLKRHPEYTFEPEPYYQLQELHGVEFSEIPTLEEFVEQLDFSIKRLNELKNDENVIFERCPVDLFCYCEHLTHEQDLSLYDNDMVDKIIDVKHSLTDLDLIVFLPMTNECPIICPESEDDYFRESIDKYLKQTYRDDLLSMLPRYDYPEIIEVWGNPQNRLNKLEAYLDSLS